MLNFIAFSLLITVLVSGVQIWRNLKKYTEGAQKTGLSYIYVPFPISGIQWFLLYKLITPPLRQLSFTKSWKWLYLNSRKNSHHGPGTMFEELGDSFFIISPFEMNLRTCNAELVAQITHRRNDFLKPVSKYKLLVVFGDSIVTVEGADWRRHKRIVGPSFSERSNKLVFEETARQAMRMMAMWSSYKGNSEDDVKVENTAPDTMTLSFHVICAAGFDLPQLWPTERNSEEGKKAGISLTGLSGNHTLPFKESMHTLLPGLKWIALLPMWLLKISPLQAHKTTMRAYNECISYFNEFRESKEKQIYRGEHDDDGTMDLLGPMVRAVKDHDPESQNPQAPILSQEELTGNSFIFFFAGHETTGNHIHFSMTYLATDLAIQKRMQADIDSIVGSKSFTEFSYHDDMPRLFNSMVGAVSNEQIRLIPAIVSVPKVANGDQVITMDGREIVIPDQTGITLNIAGANRNPRYWHHSPSKLNPGQNDIDDFVPDRWLNKNNASEPVEKSDVVPDGLETTSFEKTGSGSLFRPVKGAFLTFSEGARSCPGRRFAQVEVTAVLTAIFQKYSLELDVSDWASDEEVAKMSNDEKKLLYEKAIERARTILHRVEQAAITLQMKKGDHVPVRFMKRGTERFAGIY